jgi:hypothetical protein
MDGSVSALPGIPRGKASRTGRRSGAVGTASVSRGRQRPTLSEMLRRTAASIRRLGKMEARRPGPGRVSATPAAIAAAVVNVASRNNTTTRHPRSITTLPSVRTAVVAEAVLTVVAGAVLLPATAEVVVAVEATLRAAIAAVKRILDFPQPLRPPDRAGAAFFSVWLTAL